MRTRGWVVVAASLLALPALAADEDEARDESLVAIRAARVITVTGEEHAPGVVIVRDGRIDLVGARVEVPPRARVLDLRDGVLMPGLVSPRTRLGLARYSREGNNANLSVKDELLPEQGRFKAALEGGFVALALVPAGSGVAGQTVVVRPLDDAPLIGAAFGYVRAAMTDLPGDKRVLRDAFKAAQAAIDKEAAARAEWEKKQKAPAPPAGQAPQASTAPVSTASFTAPPIAPELRPFVAWLRKSADAPRLLLELARGADWVHLRDVAGQYELPASARYFISNGPLTDLHRVLPEVGAQKALVVLFPRLSFVANTRDRMHVPWELSRAGARVAFTPLTDDAIGYARHLEAAALAHRDGLPRDATLKALTLHPAEVLGLEQELGAIEKGRRADLVVLDGDPLEVGTRVTRVLLGGEVAWRREEARR